MTDLKRPILFAVKTEWMIEADDSNTTYNSYTFSVMGTDMIKFSEGWKMWPKKKNHNNVFHID